MQEVSNQLFSYVKCTSVLYCSPLSIFWTELKDRHSKEIPIFDINVVNKAANCPAKQLGVFCWSVPMIF